MRDKFGREITYLRVSLIDRCNLRCLYCMPKGSLDPFSKEELLSMEETLTLIRIFADLGVRKVRLTGGEPLLRKDVPWLVEQIRRRTAIQEITMTTNGVLLKRFAGDLKKAGLDRINVSLDTLDRANFTRITGMDKWTDVMDGIQSAADCGLRPLKINVVLMRGYNDHEILGLVRFAVEKGFEIRFIEWMPTAAEILEEQNNRFLSSDAAKAVIEEHFDLAADESSPHSPARTFFIKNTSSKVGFISPLSNQFCARCNRVRLKANGMLKTCLHGKEDLNLKALLREGVSPAEIRRRIMETVYDRPQEHFLNNAAVKHQDFVMTAVGG